MPFKKECFTCFLGPLGPDLLCKSCDYKLQPLGKKNNLYLLSAFSVTAAFNTYFFLAYDLFTFASNSFIFLKLEYNCFTMLCYFLLYDRVNLPPTTPSHPSRSQVSTKLSSCVLQQLPTSCLFYTWQCIYLRPTLPVHPTLPFPTLCPHICSLCLCLYSCLGNRFICIIFLDSIYIHEYTIFVFPFLCRTNPGSSHISTNDPISF